MPTESGAAVTSQVATYLGTLRRRKWTILVTTLLAVGVALGLSKSETPVYQASAKILLESTTTPVQAALGISGSQSNIADEIARLQSPGVASLVQKQLGTAPGVSGSNVSGTDIIQVTASSTDPGEAAKIANTYAKAYLQQRQTDLIDNYLQAAKVVQAEITKLQAQLAALPPGPNSGPNPGAAAIQSQIAVLQQEANTLQTETSVNATGAQIIQPATVPTEPTSPRTVRNGLVGLGGGLALGIGLAFLRENMDDTLTTKEDLDRVQPALPVLGLIPEVSGRGAGKQLVAAERPHSFAAEAYRSLRTSVQFLALDQPVKLLQVTSPRTAEGKTTVVANLATTLAAAGQRVIAVDCDLRRSRLHEVFGLPNAVGFTSVLTGETPISLALQEVQDHDNLLVLTSGERPPNPAELLSGARSADVFAALERMAEVVLVDTPPVMPVTDAVLVSARMDATLVVVSSGLTSAKDLARSLELLAQVDAPVSGVVLNRVAVNAGYRYRYRYTYSYKPEPRHSKAPERT